MSFELEFRHSSGEHDLRIAPVPWDSEVFDFAVYQLDASDVRPSILSERLPSLLQSLRPTAPSLIVCRLPVGDVDRSRVLAESRFYHVEVMYRLHINLRRLPLVSAEASLPSFQFRSVAVDDVPRIQRLAEDLFHDSRFFTDSIFPEEQSKQRFRNWIERSFGLPDDTIWCIDDPNTGSPVSFFQFRVTEPRKAWVGIGGLDAAYQTKGWGAEHIGCYYRKLAEEGYESAVTDVSSTRFHILGIYLQMGFRIIQAESVFHLFLDKEPV